MAPKRLPKRQRKATPEAPTFLKPGSTVEICSGSSKLRRLPLPETPHDVKSSDHNDPPIKQPKQEEQFDETMKADEEACPMQKKEELFSVDAHVEIRFDEPDFREAWYVATIVEARGQGKFIVQCRDLFDNDGVTFHPHRVEVDAQNLSLPPPKTRVGAKFDLVDTVDVFHNDAWWVGSIVAVPRKSKPKYKVNLWSSHELLEFDRSQLRPHHR